MYYVIAYTFLCHLFGYFSSRLNLCVFVSCVFLISVVGMKYVEFRRKSTASDSDKGHECDQEKSVLCRESNPRAFLAWITSQGLQTTGLWGPWRNQYYGTSQWGRGELMLTSLFQFQIVFHNIENVHTYTSIQLPNFLWISRRTVEVKKSLKYSLLNMNFGVRINCISILRRWGVDRCKLMMKSSFIINRNCFTIFNLRRSLFPKLRGFYINPWRTPRLATGSRGVLKIKFSILKINILHELTSKLWEKICLDVGSNLGPSAQ